MPKALSEGPLRSVLRTAYCAAPSVPALYGEDSLGPWTLMHDDKTLAAQRSTFRDALEQGGDPRPYMFGDWAAEEWHFEMKGLPDYIGYGMGYQVVRSYLNATQTTATDASYTPWREIAAGSPWLHEG